MLGRHEEALVPVAGVRHPEQALVSALKDVDVVVIDNAGAHQVEAVRTAIEAAGATLRFLRP